MEREHWRKVDRLCHSALQVEPSQLPKCCGFSPEILKVLRDFVATNGIRHDWAANDKVYANELDKLPKIVRVKTDGSDRDCRGVELLRRLRGSGAPNMEAQAPGKGRSVLHT
jgi:hypothetical protein